MQQSLLTQAIQGKVLQFWLVRHGQTEENVKKILCGQQGGTLTQLGVRQADALGKRIGVEYFDFAYVSDLTRTRNTYESIKKYQSYNTQVEYTPLIREKSAGLLDGLSLDLPRQQASKLNIPIREFRPEKGEAWIDVYERGKVFLTQIIERHLLSSVQKDIPEPKIEIQPQQQVQQQKLAPSQKQGAKPLQLQIQPQQMKIQKSISTKTQGIQFGQTQTKQNKAGIKILGVSHGGFIMEINNIVKLLMENKPPTFTNDAVNCSITIYEITLIREPKSKEDILNSVQIKVLLKNDNTHCQKIK